jgi:ABC-2 type transport system ATP-binding protein
MIEVKELTKFYGHKPGVSGINFTIQKGETVGLLGPNGAGKTTIMKMLAGHMLPTAGSIFINSIDTVENPKQAARHVGFMPELPPLYLEMDVTGYLTFIAEVKGVNPRKRAAHLKEVMEMTAVRHVKDRLIKNLSKGYRQRVGLAHALVGNPDVLILDEPTVGLDPKQITEVRKLIEKLSLDHTILLSSHILSEIKSTCKRIIIVNNGRIAVDDTVENLEMGGNSFSIHVKGDFNKVKAALIATPGVSDVSPLDGRGNDIEGYCRFMVRGRVNNSVREDIFHRLAVEDLPIIELRTIGNTLEEVFLERTA